MTLQARSWLPAAALSRPALEAAVMWLVSAWARDWFVDGSSTSITAVASDAVTRFDQWHGGDAWDIRFDEASSIAVGAACGGHAERHVTRRDRALLAHAGHAAIADLAERFHHRVSSGRMVGGSHAPSALMQRHGERAHQFMLGDRQIGWSLLIACDDKAVIALRRAIGGANAPPAQLALGTIGQALESHMIDLGTLVGSTRILAGEVARLAIGDVLVLDRKTSETLPYVIDGQSISSGRLSLRTDGDKVTFCIEQPILATVETSRS